jgi:putative SOS response-associated peptidase YedK
LGSSSCHTRPMCGRFVQAQSAQAYAEHFGAEVEVSEALDASWNVAPTDHVYAVAQHEGTRRLGTFRWGLIPWFAKDIKVGARHINARSETLATKAAFKDSFARKRCLVPADGFFEWEKLESGGKLPHYIHSTDGAPLALAGLWASWKSPEGERLATCAIVTAQPNDLIEPIHDRMPVVLPAEHWDVWLDRDYHDLGELGGFLGPVASGVLTEHAVSTLVNDVKNNYPECIEPLR